MDKIEKMARELLADILGTSPYVFGEKNTGLLNIKSVLNEVQRETAMVCLHKVAAARDLDQAHRNIKREFSL